MSDVLEMLRAPIPRDQVDWRAQSVTKSGDKALALAYIDARTLMERLDEAVGPDRWRDEYVETPKGRIICTISIKLGDEWVSKSDGAGATDVEGDKGAISDAFKRAGVKWGVARELYALKSPWVPCESYESNGKHRWKSWKADPWGLVKAPATSPSLAVDNTPRGLKIEGGTPREFADKIMAAFKGRGETVARNYLDANAKAMGRIEEAAPAMHAEILHAAEIEQDGPAQFLGAG